MAHQMLGKPKKAPAQVAAKTVKLNFDTLYEMAARNGYYVPSKKCPFVTVSYLIAVKNGDTFTPRYRDVRLRPCPVPPKKAVLVEAVMALGTQFKVDFGLSADGPFPNTQWLLALLATYNPQHPFFGKSYRPVSAK
jgi:hypothetical protein